MIRKHGVNDFVGAEGSVFDCFVALMEREGCRGILQWNCTIDARMVVNVVPVLVSGSFVDLAGRLDCRTEASLQPHPHADSLGHTYSIADGNDYVQYYAISRTLDS